ncbi:MAG: hypothetical protein HC851_23865 [Acaryochloris sp. RU_4_1]|nr:hypothetical protein [Acaryochloris sp. RU_4_1]
MFDKYISTKILPIGIATVCLYAIGFLQFSKFNELIATHRQPVDQSTYQIETNRQQASLELFKKTPAFGFDNVIADWTFLSFLQYFGDSAARKSTGYKISPEFFDVVISRDPRFIDPYLFLSTSSSLYAGQPDRSVQLMEQGLQSLSPQSDPNAYLVWLYKAIDELLFLSNNQAARRSYEQVVAWAQANGDANSQRVSAFSAKTAQFLANKPNSKSAQINAWLLVFVNAVDDNTRQRAINNIKQLGGQITFTSDGGVSVQHPKQD